MQTDGRRLTQKGLQARATLTAAAHAEFSRRGYTAASVADIVASAGLTKNHLFYHFGSKEALAAAALEQALANWRSELAMPAEIFPEAQRRLAFVVRRFSESPQHGQLRLLAAFQLDRASLPAELGKQLGAFEDELGEFWRRLLKGLKGNSALASSEKARALSGSISCLLCGAALADDDGKALIAQVEFLGRLLGSATPAPASGEE